jgi:GTP-binding protein HflX
MGGIGGRGPGEQKLEIDRRRVRDRINRLEKEIKKLQARRITTRKKREKGDLPIISIVGYTNAGKSTLLNSLTHSQVHVENRLFATLDPTSRRLRFPRDTEVIITDTVGFIEQLPAVIVEAFHSTLEELELADVIVLVVDSSEPKESVEKKLQVSFNELRTIGSSAPIVIAFNKIDLSTQEHLVQLILHLTQTRSLTDRLYVMISAKENKHIDLLLQTIYECLPHLVKITFQLPLGEKTHAFISQLYEKTHVLNITYHDVITATVECNEKIKEKLIAASRGIQGKVL